MKNQQRAAMQMALEALLDGNALFDLEGSSESYKLAITALREALAQPQGEPLGCLYDYISPMVPKDEAIAFVEAAIEATKEKAAKVCEELCIPDEFEGVELDWVKGTFDCAAAIRSMK